VDDDTDVGRTRLRRLCAESRAELRRHAQASEHEQHPGGPAGSDVPLRKADETELVDQQRRNGLSATTSAINVAAPSFGAVTIDPAT
jgi:hypothetical protein